MKLIKLTQGKFAQVNNEDYEYLNQWKWCALKHGKTFYAYRTKYIGNKAQSIYMHSLLINLLDDKITDHIDRNGLNNQKINLRQVTRTQNNWNASPHGKSKYKGVSFNNRYKKYIAKIKCNKNDIFLGYFLKEIDAAIAYNKAAVNYHKEFAYINIIL